MLFEHRKVRVHRMPLIFVNESNKLPARIAGALSYPTRPFLASG